MARHTARPIKYSVLLLYPEHMWADGPETYYTHVMAPSPSAAVLVAREELAKGFPESCEDCMEAKAELVLRGWHVEEV